jgi:hypothetical protein
MGREEFEEWLEDHGDEALNRIEGERYSLRRWIALFNQVLIIEQNEADEPEPEDEDEDEPVFDDDEEEG